MKKLRYFFLILISGISLQAYAQTFDVLIQNAVVFDGSGGDSLFYDVGIKGDRITYVGKPLNNGKAKQVIDAEGLYLAPGFMDPHTHYNSQLNHKNKENRAVLRALKQGVTTVFIGNDGTSPLATEKTMKKWDENGIGPNAALFIGHNTVRKKVLGNNDVQPTSSQMKEMQGIVEQAMTEGALGMSTGLFYTPGSFAKIDELVALSEIVKKYNGIHDTHQRDEGSQNIGVVNSTKEILEIGEKSGVRTHFSHIKVAGPKAWGKSREVIRLIEEAQQKGIDVTANQYPYLASRTSLSAALIPAWARDGGLEVMRERFEIPEFRDSIIVGIYQSIMARTADPNKLMLSSKGKEYHNKSIQQVAEEWKVSPEEAVIRICAEGNPSVHSFMMKEEDVVHFIKKTWVMVGSDGGGGHPRAFGTFAKFFEEYVLQKNITSLKEGVRKATHLTAETFQIKKRGLIKEGYFADIVLFDPQKIRANSNYDDGEVLASGVIHVFVNGKWVIKNEDWQDELSGRALKRNQ